jgi:hypothetical protein
VSSTLEFDSLENQSKHGQSIPMRNNEPRDTPGRLLLFGAVLLGTVVIFSWRVHLGRTQFDWVEYPTALGDNNVYAEMISENDFFEPAVKFPSQEKGLFRRMFSSIQRDDEKMIKVALEPLGKHYVYVAANSKGKDRRYFLKTGENAFIEFGQRKYYPTDPEVVPVPKAIPYTPKP